MIELEIGQAWVGKGPGETPPLLCAIGAIDEMKNDAGETSRVISVQITPHLEARKAGWKIISHMPFTEEAFQASALELAPEKVEFNDRFREGYDHWRGKVEAGEAGVFSIPIGQAYLGVMTSEAKRDAAAQDG